jgi:hypothetical protein
MGGATVAIDLLEAMRDRTPCNQEAVPLVQLYGSRRWAGEQK